MKQIRHLFWIVIPLIGLMFLLGNGTVAEAKKYYSLKNIGLSGCTEDDTDYGILSIRGNVIRYEIYRVSVKTGERKRIGKAKTAKLTSKTKYYVGDSKQVSSSLRKDKKRKKNDHTNDNKKYLVKKNKNIDTEKWIYRVQKRTVKKYISRRDNEIRVSKGKVTKLAVRLSY